MKISIDFDVPDHMCGNKITLSFALFKIPWVLNASFASRQATLQIEIPEFEVFVGTMPLFGIIICLRHRFLLFVLYFPL
jgi:hypothetical protein